MPRRSSAVAAGVARHVSFIRQVTRRSVRIDPNRFNISSHVGPHADTNGSPESGAHRHPHRHANVPPNLLTHSCSIKKTDTIAHKAHDRTNDRSEAGFALL